MFSYLKRPALPAFGDWEWLPVATGWASLCLLAAIPVAVAQPVSDEPPPKQAVESQINASTPQALFIREYRVIGSKTLARGEVEKAVYAYLGPGRSEQDVEQARAALKLSEAQRIDLKRHEEEVGVDLRKREVHALRGARHPGRNVLGELPEERIGALQRGRREEARGRLDETIVGAHTRGIGEVPL